MSNRHDVVWYWSGGREVGEWRRAMAARPRHRNEPATLRGLRDSLRRMGYVAHLGSRSIGAPEGAPSEADFLAVGV